MCPTPAIDQSTRIAQLEQINKILKKQLIQARQIIQQTTYPNQVSDIATYTTTYPLELLRQIIDSSPDWVFVKDRNFRYILANQSYAEAIDKTIDDILGRDDLELGFSEELVFGNPDRGIRGFREDDRATLLGNSIFNPYDPATVANGSTCIFETQKVPLHTSKGDVFACLGIARDVTARQVAEASLQAQSTELEKMVSKLQSTQAQLVQSERMSALGKMVAGVASDISNPVNFIHSNLKTLDRYTQDLLNLVKAYQEHYPNPPQTLQKLCEDSDIDFLAKIVQKLVVSTTTSSNRIQKIVGSLKSVSLLDESDFKPVNIHEDIEDKIH